MAGAGGDDLALVEEVVRDGNRLIQQPAWIVAQVQHNPVQAVTQLLAELGNGVAHGGVGLLVELGQPDVADIAFQPRLDHLDVDDLAVEREVDRVIHVLALDDQVDRAVGRSAHLIHRVVEREALDRRVVDAGDQVARLDAGAGCRRIIDWGDDLDNAVVLGDLETETAELAMGLHLHVAIGFGVHVHAMRVEAGQHAIDGILD